MNDTADDEFLAIEGATLLAVSLVDGVARLEFADADIHFEHHQMTHVAALVLTGATLEAGATALPADIDAITVRTPRDTFELHGPLPFEVTGACEVELQLSDGGRVVARGDSGRVELGPGVKQAYRW